MMFFWRKPRRGEDFEDFAQILNQTVRYHKIYFGCKYNKCQDVLLYDSSLVVQDNLFTNFLPMNSVILRLPWQDAPIVKPLIYFDYCSINNEKQLPVPSND